MRANLLGDPGEGEGTKVQSNSIGKTTFAAIAGSFLVLGCISFFSLPNTATQPDELIAAPGQLNIPRSTAYKAAPTFPGSAFRGPQQCVREVYGCSFQNPGGPFVDRVLPRMREVSSFAAVGDKFPAVEVDYGFPPTKVDMAERLKGKKTIVVGLPGAFTPVWSNNQVPGYLAKQAELKEKGVDEVLVYCVNDGAVMEGWAKDQGVAGSMITFLADTRGEMTKALDLVLDAEPVLAKLGNPRCERFAMVVEDGEIKSMAVAGGDVPDEATFAEAMLEKC